MADHSGPEAEELYWARLRERIAWQKQHTDWLEERKALKRAGREASRAARRKQHADWLEERKALKRAEREAKKMARNG